MDGCMADFGDRQSGKHDRQSGNLDRQSRVVTASRAIREEIRIENFKIHHVKTSYISSMENMGKLKQLLPFALALEVPHSSS